MHFSRRANATRTTVDASFLATGVKLQTDRKTLDCVSNRAKGTIDAQQARQQV
jgi:hypothetical protein